MRVDVALGPNTGRAVIQAVRARVPGTTIGRPSLLRPPLLGWQHDRTMRAHRLKRLPLMMLLLLSRSLSALTQALDADTGKMEKHRRTQAPVPKQLSVRHAVDR